MPKLVLIADDYDDAADLLASVLAFKIRCETRCVRDGQAAVELAKQRRPDAVILDIDMPIMDGIQAAKLIRTMYVENPPKLIACTGRANTGEVRVGEVFDALLVKPVNLDKLVKLLQL